MSRIGKQPIKLGKDIQISLKEELLEVKGPKGTLTQEIHPLIGLEINEEEITVLPKRQDKEAQALWGLFRSLINNMVQGVQTGFEKKLEFEGGGFKAQMQGDKLVLEMGFSHPVEFKAAEGIKIEVEKNVIKISGIDKQAVGQTAAKIRSIKKPEPYKGKGIRYQGEIIRRKAGKKASAA